jgi:hypothetical protein
MSRANPIPNPDLENCHCEGTEAISPFSMRLPRLRAVTSAWPTNRRQALRRAGTHLSPLLAGLAMTEWKKGVRSLNRNLGPLAVSL